MTENGGTAAKFGRIFLWLVTLVFGLAVAGAGATKFTSSASWLDLFAGWGYPAAFSYGIGTLEVLGGLAFLVPRFATYAGALLAAIMLGAIVTVVTHPGEMGPLVPGVNAVAFLALAWIRRDVRWRPS